MYIEGEDFVKLVEDLRYYMSLTPTVFIESYTPSNGGHIFPVLQLRDIKLYCMHYKTSDEAINAWERRKRRIRFENIYVLANSWDLQGNREYAERILKCGFKTVIFSDQNWEFPECIELPERMIRQNNRNLMKDIPKLPLKEFECIFNFVKWLN